MFYQGSRFDSNNDDGSEEEIETIYDDKILERNSKQHEEANRQQNEDGCDEGYAEDKSASDPNIAGRCRYQWRGVECDL